VAFGEAHQIQDRPRASQRSLQEETDPAAVDGERAARRATFRQEVEEESA
jgi:hypothetical protein